MNDADCLIFMFAFVCFASHIANCWVMIPHVVFSAVGFECDSVSSLNVSSSENRGCVEAGTGKTGNTCNGALDYFEAHSPMVVCMENVKNLLTKEKGKDKSNFDCLREKMNARGYLVFYHCQNCTRYGSCQSRDRLYVLCFKVSNGPINQFAEGFGTPQWIKEMPSLFAKMEGPQIDLDRFLLPIEVRSKFAADEETDEDTAEADQSTGTRSKKDQGPTKGKGKGAKGGKGGKGANGAKGAKGAKPKCKGDPPDPPGSPKKKRIRRDAGADEDAEDIPAWQAEHLDMFMQENMAWPINWAEAPPALVAALKHEGLPRRQQELVYFHSTRWASVVQESLHDINPSVSFGSHTIGYAPCIVSSSQMWLRKDMRVLHGSEALQLQGLPVSAYLDTAQQWSHKCLMGMAGNAFSAWHLLPNLIAILMYFPFDPVFDDLEHLQSAVPTSSRAAEDRTHIHSHSHPHVYFGA